MDRYRVGALRDRLKDAAAHAPGVSAWSVGTHLHHCGLVIMGICQALAASRPPMPPRRFSLVRTLLLATGWIPRGRAEAPQTVTPPADPQVGAVATQLDRAQACLAQLDDSAPGAWFEHPVLGPMSRDEALRFIAIHTRHHLKIIADIVRAA